MVIDNNDIPKQDYLVLCSTITYNHAPYIVDTMNGSCMQKTNFPYACYIIDDASTDGEQDVIKAYLDEHFQMDIAERYELELANVIVAKHNTNPNCTFAVYLLKRNLWREPDLKRPLSCPWTQRCKYIALCEGDDYWTDPYKLQKQVDFLDSHPDYVACFHNARIKYNNGWGLFNALDENHYPTTEDIIKRRWFIATQTLLYRNVDIPIYEWQNKVISGDYTLELKLAKMGRFYYMDDVMAVYRQTGMGASAGLNKNKLKMYDQLIWLLSNMKDVYGGMYAQAFDESIANYEAMKSDFIRSTNPIKKWFYRKTYTRAVKRWLSFIV